jgi:PKD repeat protein
MSNSWDKGRNLEERIAAIFRKKGYEVDIRKKIIDIDGNVKEIDVFATKRAPSGIERIAIECKSHETKIQTSAVGWFIQKLSGLQFSRAIFASTSGFSTDAEKLGLSHSIEMWDNERIYEEELSVPIQPIPPIQQTPPTLTLSVSINGLTVTINGDAQPTTSGASITEIKWDWHDGRSTTGWFPQTHTYAKKGTYNVRAVAYDSNGLSTCKSTSVTVSRPKVDKKLLAVISVAITAIAMYLLLPNLPPLSPPSIEIDPTQYRSVQVEGKNFPDGTLDIKLNGTLVKTLQVSQDNFLTDVTFPCMTIGKMTVGKHQIVATNGNKSASTDIEIMEPPLPQITINPTKISPGGTFVLHATGLLSNCTVNLLIQNSSGQTYTLTATSSSRGALDVVLQTSIIKEGVYEVSVSDDRGKPSNSEKLIVQCEAAQEPNLPTPPMGALIAKGASPPKETYDLYLDTEWNGSATTPSAPILRLWANVDGTTYDATLSFNIEGKHYTYPITKRSNTQITFCEPLTVSDVRIHVNHSMHGVPGLGDKVFVGYDYGTPQITIKSKT